MATFTANCTELGIYYLHSLSCCSAYTWCKVQHSALVPGCLVYAFNDVWRGLFSLLSHMFQNCFTISRGPHWFLADLNTQRGPREKTMAASHFNYLQLFKQFWRNYVHNPPDTRLGVSAHLPPNSRGTPAEPKNASPRSILNAWIISCHRGVQRYYSTLTMQASTGHS